MNSEVIKAVIQRISCGVYIIGVKTGSKVNGMTAAWVTQASFSPPTVLIAVGKTHYTADMISEAGFFSVNILSENQFDVAKKCGFISGKDTDKLADIEYSTAVTGAPLIKGTAAWMECKVSGKFEVADHWVFAGEVINAGDNGQNVRLYKPKDFFD